MKGVFLISECGTGKSLMGAVLAHVVGQKMRPDYRILVVGPPHLTRHGKAGSKWHREITATIPGARTYHLDNCRDVLGLPAMLEQARGPLWVICSRNFLKLGPPVRAAFNIRVAKIKARVEIPPGSGNEVEIEKIYRAPACPSCGKIAVDADGVPMPDTWLHKARRSCKACGSPLWEYTWPAKRSGEPDRSKPLFLPVEWLKRHVRFDLGIFDEVHELKGGGTAQGQMLGGMAACCAKTVALTGTLYGGKASDLYYLMWRLAPDRMRALGFDYHTGVQEWVARYGICQRVKERDDDVNGGRSKKRDTDTVMEKPGIVPTLFTDLLLDRAAFMNLDDLVPHLPPGTLPPRPQIERILVPLGELSTEYRKFHENVVYAIKDATKGRRTPPMNLLSAMYSGLDCWPDHPFGFAPIENFDKEGNCVSSIYPPSMPDVPYEKDRRLVQLVKGELAKGRRCLVYTVHTVKHPVSERLRDLLEQADVKVSVLDGVATDKREEWIAEQLKQGVQVVITHPGKVETGLDLLAFPTIIFHSMGVKPFTFRQAGARAWRIGQTQRCRIIIMAYQGTMQELIAGLMMVKLKAATRLEGQVLADLATAGGEDITDQILKAVVHDQRVEIEAPEAGDPIEEVPVHEPIVVTTRRDTDNLAVLSIDDAFANAFAELTGPAAAVDLDAAFAAAFADLS